MFATTTTAVRNELVEALRLDLIGPDNDHAFADELLPESPTRWYLTGFLVPRGAPEEQRRDAQPDDEVDAGPDLDPDDGGPADRAAAGKSYLPSSLGLSVLVAPAVDRLETTVVWGDYAYEGAAEDAVPEVRAQVESPPAEEPTPPEAPEQPSHLPTGYRRMPRAETLGSRLAAAGRAAEHDTRSEQSRPGAGGDLPGGSCHQSTPAGHPFGFRLPGQRASTPSGPTLPGLCLPGRGLSARGHALCGPS